MAGSEPRTAGEIRLHSCQALLRLNAGSSATAKTFSLVTAQRGGAGPAAQLVFPTSCRR